MYTPQSEREDTGRDNVMLSAGSYAIHCGYTHGQTKHQSGLFEVEWDVAQVGLINEKADVARY